MKDACGRAEERIVTIPCCCAVKQREVDERTETTDTVVLQILEKLIKQRRESAVQFAAGNRPDLEARELAEITLLKVYLPTPLSQNELDGLIRDVMATTGATSMKDMGKVMASLREKAQGRVGLRYHRRESQGTSRG